MEQSGKTTVDEGEKGPHDHTYKTDLDGDGVTSSDKAHKHEIDDYDIEPSGDGHEHGMLTKKAAFMRGYTHKVR